MRISTIIPAYNRADLIGETLRSVLEQDRPPAEVIVVDDGSSDGTPDVVASYGKAVTLIRQANAGPGPARNTGFAASSGEIVHFMDSDDLISLNFYAVAAAAIEGGAEMTYGPWLKTRIDGRMLDPETYVIQQGPIPPQHALRDLLLLMEWGIVFQPCLFRREILTSAGPYRSDLNNWEDNELLYRIAGVAKTSPVHVAHVLTLYRLHPENQITQRGTNRRALDHAGVAAILSASLDRRTGISPGVRRAFARRKYDISLEVRRWDATQADLLAIGVPLLVKATRPLWQLARRINARMRVAARGNPYPPTFAVAPLREDQRCEIARLGYVLPD